MEQINELREIAANPKLYLGEHVEWEVSHGVLTKLVYDSIDLLKIVPGDIIVYEDGTVFIVALFPELRISDSGEAMIKAHCYYKSPQYGVTRRALFVCGLTRIFGQKVSHHLLSGFDRNLLDALFCELEASVRNKKEVGMEGSPHKWSSSIWNIYLALIYQHDSSLYKTVIEKEIYVPRVNDIVWILDSNTKARVISVDEDDLTLAILPSDSIPLIQKKRSEVSLKESLFNEGR